MRYVITEEDKSSVLYSTNYRYRIYITDNNDRIMDVLTDFVVSDFSIDGTSNIRRTLSITVNQKYHVTEYVNTCLMYNFKFQIGVINFRTGDVIWYDCGTFVPIDASTTYDENTNCVTFSLADWFSKLDGTRNGQIGGAQTILIPNKDEDNNFVEIRTALINFMSLEGYKNLIIDKLGEFYGMQSNNPEGYEEYRKNNPLWDKLPYDLEFECGCTIADIILEIINIYPNIQAYFDVYNNFCAGMIPSCNHNPVELDNDYLQKVLLGESSESVTYDIQSIRNVTEVFGKIYDVEHFSEECMTSSNVYEVTLQDYSYYSSYELIAFIPNSTNIESMQMKINDLEEIPIYKEYTTEYVSTGEIIADEMCVMRIMRDSNMNYVAYYLGKYQPHALCVLTDDINDPKYTKEYFSDKYNCKNVILRQEKGSPFTVQKIGEMLDVKSGSEYENIISDTVAVENAIYQNQISSSMNETIQLSTVLLPWLDVQCKVSYRKSQEKETISEYIIESINNSDTTSTITMRKFYPLYYM